VLHYSQRKNKIFILTLDSVLAEDVQERLTAYPALRGAQFVVPGRGGAITVEEVESHARDTLTAKILIIDVRSQTKPLLQRAYSDVVRFNRPDLNNYCFSVLIGDGPVNLHNNKGIQSFQNYLCDLRTDYSPAVFFVDPFLHYSFEEKQDALLFEHNVLPERIPRHLERYFTDQNLTIRQIREYFRCAGVDEAARAEKKTKRHEKLQRIFARIIDKQFSQDKEDFTRALSYEGCPLPGEPLRLNAYPFFFEKWICDLYIKAAVAAAESRHIA
jgi:hypothetical protein